MIDEKIIKLPFGFKIMIIYGGSGDRTYLKYGVNNQGGRYIKLVLPNRVVGIYRKYD